MTELNGYIGAITVIDADDFSIDYVNSGDFGVFASGSWATTLTADDISKTMPAQVTHFSHGLATGFTVSFSNMVGMTQLEGWLGTITVVDTNTFTLDGVDSTAYGTFVSGTYAVAGSFTIVNDITLQQTRAYVYRYLSAYGEAGPPSPPSALIDLYPGAKVSLASMDVAPAGNHNIVSKEIYRTNTGTSATDYQYVGTVAVASTTFDDSVDSSALGEVLDSLLWDPPPADLSGLIALPQGSLCGFSGNQICFSIPYAPHAWPVNQQYNLADAIVGIGSYGATVLVATTGPPCVVNLGTDLTTLQPVRMENGYACVSKRGVVDMGYSIAYPEPDGLRVVGVNSANLQTAPVLDKDSWQALHPGTISAYYYGGLYIAFTDIGCFSFDQSGNLVDMVGIAATAGYHDPETGTLYLAIGEDIVQWDAGTGLLTYVWRSRPIALQRPANMNCGQVYADTYPVTFRLYANEALVATATVESNLPFRLPGGYMATEFKAEIEGTQNVYEVVFAESMEEVGRAT
jgi:hypothetical protein